MHDRDFGQSEVMAESADMRDREGVDPRESFPMHFARNTDGGDYEGPFFLPGVPWDHAPFGGGRGRGFGRRGRGMMMMMTDPRGSMFLPRPMFHPDRPIPVFGGRGRGGRRGRGTGRGRGGCGRGGWRGFDDAMVERFEHCRLTEDPTSDSDASGGGSGESDTGEVNAQHQNLSDRREDGVTSHQTAASNPNEPTADGDKDIPSPLPHRRRGHPRLHHRCQGHCMKHRGLQIPSPAQHPYFAARFYGVPPMWQSFSDCDQQGHCKKCFKKSIKRSFKAHKKAWKRCSKKGKQGIWKSDGECVHSDDVEAGDDGEEFPTSPYPWGYSPYPWGYLPPHFLHRKLRRQLRRRAEQHCHCGKGKCCGHGCGQQGKPSTTTKEQQQTTGDEQCDVIDDDTMLMDDGDHQTAAEPKSSSNTGGIPASGTSGN